MTLHVDEHQAALHDLAAACTDFKLRSRFVEYNGRPELRVWDVATQGVAVQIGTVAVDGVPWFSRQGRPIARCDDLPEAVNAVRSRIRRRAS